MNLMAIIQRDHCASDKVTLGKMYLPWINGHPDLYTNELLWRDNQQGISCIPAGIYTLKPYSSPNKAKKAKQNVWEYQDVPNRSKCLIHAANYACDILDKEGNVLHKNELEGCTAPGFTIDESMPMVGRSGDAMEYLRTMIGIKTTWQIEIRN